MEDAQDALLEVFGEMDEQLEKEVRRLGELRRIREQDPGGFRFWKGGIKLMIDEFYIVDTEPALEGVDVATNASTVATNFTRYTVAPSTVFTQSTRLTGWVVDAWMRLMM